MRFIDTHAHLYDPIYDEDCDEMIGRSVDSGVDTILLADVDSRTREAMKEMVSRYPSTCRAMVGIHPTAVNELCQSWREEISLIEEELKKSRARYIAVGEIGVDLYWSANFVNEQRAAFEAQLNLALDYSLPVAIHIREAWELAREILSQYKGKGLRGVIHAFSGGVEDYMAVKGYGEFVFGIGGVVTFKKSTLADVVSQMSLEDIVLETDAPYLTPTPYRGKRNESSYVPLIAEKIAQIKGVTIEGVARTTTANAIRIFGEL